MPFACIFNPYPAMKNLQKNGIIKCVALRLLKKCFKIEDFK